MKDFETLIKQSLADVSMAKIDKYMEKFSSPEVKNARNLWHAAAVEVDYSRRLAGESSQRYTRALIEEAETHWDYCLAKDLAGILERVNGGREIQE